MPTVERDASVLLVVDVQARLMPAIAEGDAVVREIGRLLKVAALLGVRVVVTEQNPAGLGGTVQGLVPEGAVVVEKMTFDACKAAGFAAVLGAARDVVVVGCEAHVCVLQTVLGVLAMGRRVFLVRDAVGSRTLANREAAMMRMAGHGAEVVTAEMVAFEWMGSAEDGRFRDLVRLVK